MAQDDTTSPPNDSSSSNPPSDIETKQAAVKALTAAFIEGCKALGILNVVTLVSIPDAQSSMWHDFIDGEGALQELQSLSILFSKYVHNTVKNSAELGN